MSALAYDLGNLKPGFADPTRGSQAVFRALMDAAAHPGRVVSLGFAPDAPEGLSRAAGAIVLTLADQDAPIWASEKLRTSDAGAWLRFHTGAPFVSSPQDAFFAVITDATSHPNLSEFHQGDAKYPDRAATVIVETRALDQGTMLNIEGPGIAGKRRIPSMGLEATFWREREELVSHFQFGIDLFVTAGDCALALPRTTRISF